MKRSSEKIQSPAQSLPGCLSAGRHRTSLNATSGKGKMLKTLMDSGEESRHRGFIIRGLP
jgi:hypothetical protein